MTPDYAKAAPVAAEPVANTDFIPKEVLTRYRRRNEAGWKRILSMTDVLDKAMVEFSLERGADDAGCDPYDTSSRLPRLED